MTRINLLPWREQRRDLKKKKFIATLISMFVLGIALFALWSAYLSHVIEEQKSRNQFLIGHINMLSKKVSEIKGIKTKKQEMLDRMKVIQGLQGNRPVTVRIFDQLARIVPDGLYFKKVELKGGDLKLVGVADANQQISQFMRNLNQSEWFEDPNLTAVRKTSESGVFKNEFNLLVKQVAPISLKLVKEKK